MSIIGDIKARFQEAGFRQQQGQSSLGTSPSNFNAIVSALNPATRVQASEGTAASQTGKNTFIGPAYTGPAPTTTYSGGGGTSAPPVSPDGGGGGAPLEPTPSQPSIDFDAIFRPAFDALGQQEAASRSGYEAGVSELQQGTLERKQGLESERERRMTDFGQQRKEATGQTQSAIQEARRQAAEILQGIQSRYGGSTGTGRFQSEILGAQATRNIAQNQAALQNTMGKIGDAENELQTQITTLINNEDARLENAKKDARAQLQQALADIAKERGRLEGEKAQMRINTLNEYQNVVAQINARNTAFKQQLFMQAQDAQNQLDSLRSQAQKSYQVRLTPSTLSNFVDAGVVTPQQASQLPIGADITGQRIEDLLPVGVGTITNTNDQNSLNSALGL